MVRLIEGDEPSIYVEFHEVISGQLRFLGLNIKQRWLGTHRRLTKPVAGKVSQTILAARAERTNNNANNNGSY